MDQDDSSSSAESTSEEQDEISPIFFQKKLVQTLKEICSKVCANHWLEMVDGEDHKRWLQGLEPHLINRIVHTVSSLHKKKMKDLAFLNSILETRCTVLKLYRGLPNNPCLVDFQKLEHLDISGCIIPRDSYMQLARNLPNVTSLELQGTGAFNGVLRSLGKHSTKLEWLTVYDNPDITDEGISDLCSTRNDEMRTAEPRATQIHTLDIFATSVTLKGCYVAMLSLPNLTKLLTEDIFGIFRQFQNELLERGLDKPFPIQSLNGDLSSKPAIIIATNLCPNVMKLYINLQSSKQEEILPILGKFEKLRELTLKTSEKRSNSNFAEHFSNFLQIRGSSLSHLRLEKVPINLNLLGCFCPNLFHLSLTDVDYKGDPVLVNEGNVFQNIRILNIIAYSQPRAQDLRLLIFNCIKIEHLFLRNIRGTMTDALLLEALQRNPMSRLEFVRFTNCINISDKSLNVLIASVPSIVELIQEP